MCTLTPVRLKEEVDEKGQIMRLVELRRICQLRGVVHQAYKMLRFFESYLTQNEHLTMTPVLKSSLVASGIFLALIYWHYIMKRKRSRLPLPPGPKGLPIVGNLYDIPADKPWTVYDKWFQKYGMSSTLFLRCASSLTSHQAISFTLKSWGNR